MNYEIIPTESFGKSLKKLKKKYPLIGDDIRAFSRDIEREIKLGEPLGKDCFKVRMQITGKNAGKSGGARIILNLKIIQKRVYLLAIYDKGGQETITEKEIDRLLSKI